MEMKCRCIWWTATAVLILPVFLSLVSFWGGDAEASPKPVQVSTWAKNYGGVEWNSATSIQQTKDGGYILAGESYPIGAGGWDDWVLKLDSKGGIVFNPSSGASTKDTTATSKDTAVTPGKAKGTASDTTATVKNTSVIPHPIAKVEQKAP